MKVILGFMLFMLNLSACAENIDVDQADGGTFEEQEIPDDEGMSKIDDTKAMTNCGIEACCLYNGSQCGDPETWTTCLTDSGGNDQRWHCICLPKDPTSTFDGQFKANSPSCNPYWSCFGTKFCTQIF